MVEEYDRFVLSAAGSITSSPMLYEGQGTAGIVTPSDLTLIANRFIFTNAGTGVEKITVNAVSSVAGMTTPITKLTYDVPSSTTIALDRMEMPISVSQNYGLQALSTSGDVSVQAYAYFEKGTGQPS